MVRSRPTGNGFDEVCSYLKMLRTAARTEKMERAACWCAQVAPCVVVRCSELFEGQRTRDIVATEKKYAFGLNLDPL